MCVSLNRLVQLRLQWEQGKRLGFRLQESSIFSSQPRSSEIKNQSECRCLGFFSSCFWEGSRLFPSHDVRWKGTIHEAETLMGWKVPNIYCQELPFEIVFVHLSRQRSRGGRVARSNTGFCCSLLQDPGYKDLNRPNLRFPGGKKKTGKWAAEFWDTRRSFSADDVRVCFSFFSFLLLLLLLLSLLLPLLYFVFTEMKYSLLRILFLSFRCRCSEFFFFFFLPPTPLIVPAQPHRRLTIHS